MFYLSVILQKKPKMLPTSLIRACNYKKQSKCFVSHRALIFFSSSSSFSDSKLGCSRFRILLNQALMRRMQLDFRRRCYRSRGVNLPVRLYSACLLYFIPIVNLMMSYCCSQMFMCMIIEIFNILVICKDA